MLAGCRSIGIEARSAARHRSKGRLSETVARPGGADSCLAEFDLDSIRSIARIVQIHWRRSNLLTRVKMRFNARLGGNRLNQDYHRRDISRRAKQCGASFQMNMH